MDPAAEQIGTSHAFVVIFDLRRTFVASTLRAKKQLNKIPPSAKPFVSKSLSSNCPNPFNTFQQIIDYQTKKEKAFFHRFKISRIFSIQKQLAI
jgi:hypothetical protein